MGKKFITKDVTQEISSFKKKRKETTQDQPSGRDVQDKGSEGRWAELPWPLDAPLSLHMDVFTNLEVSSP